MPASLETSSSIGRSWDENIRKESSVAVKPVVLFADVKGSMDLSEQVDPEKWHGILDRFFQALSDGVHRFEGPSQNRGNPYEDRRLFDPSGRGGRSGHRGETRGRSGLYVLLGAGPHHPAAELQHALSGQSRRRPRSRLPLADAGSTHRTHAGRHRDYHARSGHRRAAGAGTSSAASRERDRFARRL